jgi:hypothetical protein
MRCALAVALIAVLPGCATIVGDETHVLPITSSPSEAAVVITDEKGTEVFRGTTPTSATLQKGDGSYWGGKTHTVRLSKDGYDTQVVPVTSHPNGWYIGGNIVFGGLIGWFLVDPWSGKMYNLSPQNVEASLPARPPPR